MGIELARAFITVGADSSEASAAFQQIERSAEQSMANVKRIMTSVLGFVGSYIGANQIKKGLFAAGTIEQDQIAFETLLGSAEETKKLIADLTDFAAKTPFEMPQIKVAARGLVTFGERGDELMTTLKVLGNAAAGTSSDFGMLALIFNQIRGVGRLLTQDFRQLASRGVISLQEVADYYGVTTSAAQEMMSKGKISFEDVRKMLSKFSQEGGKFFNLMERQSGSFLGMMSTVKDTVNITMASIGEGIRPAATMIMGATLPILETIRAFTQATGPLVGNIAVMTTAITTLTTSILAARTAMKMMGLTFRSVLIGTGWGIALVAVGVVLGAVVTGIQKLHRWLMTFAPVQEAVARMTERLSVAWEIFKQTMMTVGTAIWNALRRVGDVILNYFGVSLEGLPGTVSEVFVSILDSVSNFAIRSASLFGAIVENWSSVWQVIKQASSTAWQEIVERSAWAWEQVGVQIRGAVAGMQGVFIYLAEHWKSVLAAIVDVSVLQWTAIASALGAAFEAIDWGKLGDAFGNLMKTWASHQWGMISGFAELFSWLIDNWKTVLERMMNMLKSFAMAGPAMLAAALKAAMTPGKSIGDAVADSFEAWSKEMGSGVDEAFSLGSDAAGKFADGYSKGMQEAQDLLGVNQSVWESLGDIGTEAYNAASAAAQAGMAEANDKITALKNEMSGVAEAYSSAREAALADENLTFEESEKLKGMKDKLGNLTSELKEQIEATRAKIEADARKSPAGKPTDEKGKSKVKADEAATAAEKGGTSGFAQFGEKIQGIIFKASEGAKTNDLLAEGNKLTEQLPDKIAGAIQGGPEVAAPPPPSIPVMEAKSREEFLGLTGEGETPMQRAMRFAKERSSGMPIPESEKNQIRIRDWMASVDRKAKESSLRTSLFKFESSEKLGLGIGKDRQDDIVKALLESNKGQKELITAVKNPPKTAMVLQ